MNGPDALGAPHPVLAALEEIGMGWLAAFADQGFGEIAAVVALAQREGLAGGQ